MLLTQTHIEVFLDQMERSTQEMSKILSSLELLDMLLLLCPKLSRYVDLMQFKCHIFPNFVFDFLVVKYRFASCKRQGVGGIVELAPGYLPAVYSSIKKAGGLCIADEVQSGFARTGSHFWGFEIQGVVPDIVTMAKVNLFSVPFSRNQKT